MNPGTRTVACTACHADFLDCLGCNIARPLRVVDSYADGPVTLDAIWPTVPQTSEIPRYNGEPMLPPPVGVATYVTRRRFPAPWDGVRFVLALACLLPLAYAIAESGAR